MLYAAFITATIVSSGYLLWAKRNIDVFLIGTLSGVLYFFSAYTGSLPGRDGYATLPVHDVMYASYTVFLFCMLTLAFISDRLQACGSNNRRLRTPRAYKLLVQIWVAGTAILAVLLIADADLYFSGSKRTLKALESPLPMMFKIGCIISVTMLVSSRRPLAIVLAIPFCVIALLLGQRSPIALAGLAVLLIWGRELGPVSLLRRFPLLTLVGAPGAILATSLAKPLYGAVRAGDIWMFFERIQDSVSEVIYRGSEFTRIQYQFAAVIYENFQTDGGHILRSPFSLLPIPRSVFTTPSSEFNDLYQPVLFPDVPGGMAYNPFSEFYAGAGFLGVVVFCIVFSSIMFFFALALRQVNNRYIIILLSICAATASFYIQRNSFANILGLTRNVLWPMLAVGGTVALLAMAVRTSENTRVAG